MRIAIDTSPSFRPAGGRAARLLPVLLVLAAAATMSGCDDEDSPDGPLTGSYVVDADLSASGCGASQTATMTIEQNGSSFLGEVRDGFENWGGSGCGSTHPYRYSGRVSGTVVEGTVSFVWHLEVEDAVGGVERWTRTFQGSVEPELAGTVEHSNESGSWTATGTWRATRS